MELECATCTENYAKGRPLPCYECQRRGLAALGVPEVDRLRTALRASQAEIARLTRERDEAVRVAVWAARTYAGSMGGRGRIRLYEKDSDIYRALREAMGASEGGGESDG